MTNPSPAAQRIAVIGAGLVGSACALALAAEGHRVTILDPDPPGAGTSSGNAGGIVTGAVVPTATPQLLRALPGYVLDRNGPAVLRLRVRGLTRRADGVTLQTEAGPQDFARVVIAAGAWSASLARQAGDRVSLDTERGYHLGFGAGTEGLLRRPVGLPALGMVLSPMQGGLRLVSGDELAGLAAAPDFRRIRALLPGARRALPGLADKPVVTEWMGFRPSTPDSLPVIGPSPKGPQVVHAFGHGHLGLTLSAITALMVADAVAGRAPRIDPTPYGIGRF